MFFAAIYVPDFLVEAVVRAQPSLRGAMVAIVDGVPPLVKVVEANLPARAAGIEAGMSKVEAEAMPGLALRPRSPALEAAAHRALLECAQAFSPHVEETAADTALLELAGLEPLFGPPQKMARELARRVREQGLEARVAVASNPDAAVHAARGFPGVTFIPAGREAEFLGLLPLEVLFPDPRAEAAQQLLETFDRWGLRTFRALAALPTVALSERLGAEGLRLQALARGAVSRPLLPLEEPLEFEETLELEHPVALLEPLAFLLNRMLERLCARLAGRALALNELTLTCQLERLIADFRLQIAESHGPQPANSAICNLQSSIHRRTLRFPLPTTDARTLLKLLHLDLEAHPPGAPVVKIALAAASVKPRPPQGGLFAPLTPPPEKLELTLARLAGVVGEEQVGSAELEDTHRPDAFRMGKFGREIQNAKFKMQNAKKLALRRFRPPRRAQVEVRGGRPAELRFGSLRGRVVEVAGPWRTSGEWWTGEGWARDEWDVALALQPARDDANVLLCRVYRDLGTGEWFVEGSYD